MLLFLFLFFGLSKREKKRGVLLGEEVKREGVGRLFGDWT